MKAHGSMVDMLKEYLGLIDSIESAAYLYEATMAKSLEADRKASHGSMTVTLFPLLTLFSSPRCTILCNLDARSS